MTTGEQLQLAGVDANLAAASAPHRDEFLRHAEKALSELIAAGEEFDAEDIRRRIPTHVGAHHHNVLPSLMSRASRSGLITYVGNRRADRRSRHAGRIGRWIGCQNRSHS